MKPEYGHRDKKKGNLMISISLGLLVIASVALPFIIMALRGNLAH